MQVSGFRIYFLEPGYFFSKILSEFRKKIVALQERLQYEQEQKKQKQVQKAPKQKKQDMEL